MSTMMKLSLGISLALALATTTVQASAAGLVLDSSELAAKSRSSLKADIEKARIETPELFRQVYDVAKRAGELDAGSRRPGRAAHDALQGARAARSDADAGAPRVRGPRPRGSHADRASRAARRSPRGRGHHPRCAGRARSSRASPFATATSTRRAHRPTRSGASAPTRPSARSSTALESADAAGAAGGERVHALLAGVGSSRRIDGTTLLAKRLDAHPDAATAKALAKALGTAGNAWAWKTLSSRTDEATVRELAARALVKAYVAYGGEARTAASNALMVVDDAHTAALVTEARRTASADQAAALDELAARFAANPTH